MSDVDSKLDTMVAEVHDTRTKVESVPALIKALFALCIIIFLFCVALQWQIIQRNKVLDRTEDSAHRAEASSDAAYKILESAIRSGEENAPDTAAAVESIHRIEALLKEMAARQGG
jgi:hypothetical protein